MNTILLQRTLLMLLIMATLLRIAFGTKESKTEAQTPAFDLSAVPQKPANLDFAQGILGSVPNGWFMPLPSKQAGYAVKFVKEGDRPAHHGILMTSSPSDSGDQGGMFGNLMQTFNATAYRGKRVRFRAYVRYEGAPMTGQAQLWLRVDRHNGQAGFFNNMGDRPITDRRWKPYEIVGTVDKDADLINIGMMLLGKGKVWMAHGSFDVLTK